MSRDLAGVQPRPAGRGAAPAWAAVGVVGLALAVWLSAADQGDLMVDGVAPAAPLAPAVVPPPGAAVPSPPAAPAADLEQWRSEATSLRDTELDGQWGLDAQGRLQPTAALRQRFDHLLLLRDGEASVATLTQYIRQAVQAQAGAAAAQQVLDIWRRYLVLLELPFTTRVDMARPDTWGPALAERQRARRDHLGLAWTSAFYGEEEAALQALINNAQAGTASVADAASAAGVEVLGPQGLQRAGLSAEQRERLAAVDAEQARWNERLAQARSEINALRAAAHLSDPQRRDAIEDWLARHFDAQERLRIRALLDLPPPGTR